MKTILSWSSGKDAAYTLHRLSQAGTKPDLLLTTVNQDFQRVSMHGLRIKLLEKQANALQIPLYQIPLPKDVDMSGYNQSMQKHLQYLKNKGFDTMIFGDIFLEDLKKYRIEQLNKVQFKTRFPLWQKDTRKLALEIIDNGIEAIVVTVNAKLLDNSFVGRKFDRSFLNDLPQTVDWCGENGEFHTFVYNSPQFINPIRFATGKKTFKSYKPCTKSDQNSYQKKATHTNDKWDTGFWYIDVLCD